MSRDFWILLPLLTFMGGLFSPTIKVADCQRRRAELMAIFATKDALSDLQDEVIALRSLVGDLQKKIQSLEATQKQIAQAATSKSPPLPVHKEQKTTPPPAPVQEVEPVTPESSKITELTAPGETELVQFGTGVIFPTFRGGGEEKNELTLESDSKVALYAVGFHGPLGQDSYYDVTITVKKYKNKMWSQVLDSKMKKVYAKRDQVMYYDFDVPFIVEESKNENRYLIEAVLSGPETKSNAAQPSRWYNFVGSGNVTFKSSFYPVNNYAELEYIKLA